MGQERRAKRSDEVAVAEEQNGERHHDAECEVRPRVGELCALVAFQRSEEYKVDSPAAGVGVGDGARLGEEEARHVEEDADDEDRHEGRPILWRRAIVRPAWNSNTSTIFKSRRCLKTHLFLRCPTVAD